MSRFPSTLPAVIVLAFSLLAGVGQAAVEPATEAAPIWASSPAVVTEGGVEVTTTEIGPNRYKVVATAIFGRSVGKIWATFHNFEKVISIGLPDTNDFEWLDGGSPGQVPSSFQFSANGETILEEVYSRDNASHTLRYRLLQPALGFVAIDSELQFTPISNKETRYTATREVTMEPGVPVDGLAAVIAAETTTMQAYFAKKE
jgi:hypothetical protein